MYSPRASAHIDITNEREAEAIIRPYSGSTIQGSPNNAGLRALVRFYGNLGALSPLIAPNTSRPTAFALAPGGIATLVHAIELDQPRWSRTSKSGIDKTPVVIDYRMKTRLQTALHVHRRVAKLRIGIRRADRTVHHFPRTRSNLSRIRPSQVQCHYGHLSSLGSRVFSETDPVLVISTSM